MTTLIYAEMYTNFINPSKVLLGVFRLFGVFLTFVESVRPAVFEIFWVVFGQMPSPEPEYQYRSSSGRDNRSVKFDNSFENWSKGARLRKMKVHKLYANT